jgi:hypothetical protein
MADAPPDVPEDMLAELLTEPFDRFVAARNAKAKELRAEGRRDEAGAVAALRKPPKVVWELLRTSRDDEVTTRRFADAAAKVRKAQGRGNADELRAATKDLREAIARLAGNDVDVADALRAVAGHEEAVADLIAGRLTALPEAGGLGPLPTKAATRPSKKGPTPAERRQAAEAAKRVERARKDVARAEDAVSDLETRLDTARTRLERARAELDQLESSSST